MKKLTRFALVLAMLAVVLPGAAWAATTSSSHTATVDVANVLSIEASDTNFTVVYDQNTGTTAGSSSTGKTVSYTVKANNMANAAIAGALSAKINTLLDGITFRANPGMTYTNSGSAGNAILSPVDTAAIAIGTSDTALADKPASTGNAGKVLNGIYFVNWGSVANRDLADVDGGNVTLTVTLKDV